MVAAYNAWAEALTQVIPRDPLELAQQPTAVNDRIVISNTDHINTQMPAMLPRLLGDNEK